MIYYIAEEKILKLIDTKHLLITETEKPDELNIHQPNEDDIFAHISLSPPVTYGGAGFEKQGVYMLNALYGQGRGRSFFPEMLFWHPFMEKQGSASVYQAILPLFQHHNVYFFEIIDSKTYCERSQCSACSSQPTLPHGTGGKELPVRSISLELYVKEITNWLEGRSLFTTKNNIPELTDFELAAINAAADKLRLTKAMQSEFNMLIRKYKLRGGDIGIIYQYLSSENINISNKKEAKETYAKFKKILME